MGTYKIVNRTANYAIALALLALVLITMIDGYIEQSPVRVAVIKENQKDGSTKRKRTKTTKVGSLTDEKLIRFVEYVSVTCFSLTRQNYQSKSDYCANMYFSRSAGRSYKSGYANDVKYRFDSTVSNIYTALPIDPIINLRPNRLKGRNYYQVVVPALVTEIGIRNTSTIQRNAMFYVMPSVNTENARQFMIIGLRF